MTDGGERFTVKGIRTAECPVSLIKGASSNWVETFSRMKRMKENGAALFGSDLSQWPARTVAAMDVLETENLRYEQAEREALEKGRK